MSAMDWNHQCGAIFWHLAARYDWTLLLAEEKNVGCVGGICYPGEEAVDMYCSESCSEPQQFWPTSCKFTLNRYASELVYMSQLYAASVVNSAGSLSSKVAAINAAQSGMQVFLNTLVFAASSDPSSPSSSVALVKAQIAALGATSSALGQMSAAGYVPRFNFDFYNKQARWSTRQSTLCMKNEGTHAHPTLLPAPLTHPAHTPPPTHAALELHAILHRPYGRAPEGCGTGRHDDDIPVRAGLPAGLELSTTVLLD